MKKFLAIMLAVLCLLSVVSMVACGDGEKKPGDGDADDAVLQNIIKTYQDSVMEESTAEVTYTSADGTVAYEETFALTVKGGTDKDDNPLDYLTLPYFNYVGIGDGGITMPEYIDGTITGNIEAETEFRLSAIDISTAYFENGEYTFAKQKFEAVITDCDGFFGTDLNIERAEFTMTLASNMVKRMSIEYTTALGYLVTIKVEFTF